MLIQQRRNENICCKRQEDEIANEEVKGKHGKENNTTKGQCNADEKALQYAQLSLSNMHVDTS